MGPLACGRRTAAVFRALTRDPDRHRLVHGRMGRPAARPRPGAGRRSASPRGHGLIAPATDFTEELIWPVLPQAIRREIEEKGFWRRPADAYGQAYPLTRRLFEDGRANCLFGGEIRTFCPTVILQGMQDPDVPWRHAMKLVEHLAADPVTISLIRDGDHRLSRPQDMAALEKSIRFSRPQLTA